MSWVIRETIKKYRCVTTTEKINTLHLLQYVKLPINAHRVISIFEVSDCYLIDPAKRIFRKFPKLTFLKNILILPQVFY